MSNKAGSDRFLLQAAGAPKVLSVAATFFNSCMARLGNPLPRPRYQPWMSSVDFARDVSLGKAEPSVEFTEPLRFDQAYLEAVAALLNSHEGLDVFADLPGCRVFVEIERHRPHSAEVFRRAHDLVELWFPWQRRLFQTIIHAVLPICRVANREETGNSSSNKRLIGAFLASVSPQSPFPDICLNIDFSHELAHQVLMMYQHGGDLILEPDAWVYSGIRKTLRPAAASLHAGVALGYMIECARALLARTGEIDRSAFLRARLFEYRESLSATLTDLQPLPKSPLGQRVMDDLFSVLD